MKTNLTNNEQVVLKAIVENATPIPACYQNK